MESERQSRSRGKRKSHSPRKVLSHYVCLNPHCSNFTRTYSLESQKVTDHPHSLCQGWSVNLTQREQSKEEYLKANHENSDLLLNPIKSIKMLAHHSQCQWLEQISNIFKMLQSELIEYLNDILGKKFKQISESIVTLAKTSKNIDQLTRNMLQEKWFPKHEKFYKQYLQVPLIELSSLGRVNVFNYDAVTSQIDRIKREMERVVCGIWEVEPEYMKKQRIKERQIRRQMKQISVENKEDIYLKLQKIYKTLKLKPYVLEERHNMMFIKCGRCDESAVSSLEIKHERKTQCFYNLLKHFYRKHNQEVIEQVLKKGKKERHHLQHNQFLKEITNSKHKEYLVIDRENINTQSAVSITDDDIYTLEVVSSPRENLATGRYLVAESSGKDAADILILVVLIDLARTVGRAKITLITNDHFGKTMQPIFAALGMVIHLSNKFEAIQKSFNQSSSQMIIQEP